MSCARNAAGIVAAFVLAAVYAHGETPATPAPSATAEAPPPGGEATEESRWSFSASVYTFIVPDDQDFAQPTVTADRSGCISKRATTTRP